MVSAALPAGPTTTKLQQRVCCCGPIFGQTDGQTDTVPFHRFCSAYYTGSVNNLQRLADVSYQDNDVVGSESSRMFLLLHTGRLLLLMLQAFLSTELIQPPQLPVILCASTPLQQPVVKVENPR